MDEQTRKCVRERFRQVCSGWHESLEEAIGAAIWTYDMPSELTIVEVVAEWKAWLDTDYPVSWSNESDCGKGQCNCGVV